MADTADKHAGSLFDVVPVADAAPLRRRGARGRRAGRAGGRAARPHAAALADLAPDFAGFRSAVCVGGRSQALDATCLRDLVDAMRQVAPA